MRRYGRRRSAHGEDATVDVLELFSFPGDVKEGETECGAGADLPIT